MSIATVTKVVVESSKHRTQAARFTVFAFTGLQFSEKTLQNFVEVWQWNILQLPRHLSGYSLWVKPIDPVLVERFVFLLKFKSCSLFSSTESAFAKLSPTAEVESACWVELSGCSSVYFNLAYQRVQFHVPYLVETIKYRQEKALWTALLPFRSD